MPGSYTEGRSLCWLYHRICLAIPRAQQECEAGHGDDGRDFPHWKSTSRWWHQGKDHRCKFCLQRHLQAKRVGVHLVFLPAENKRDFDDLPDFIRKDIEVKFVSHYDELLRDLFPPS